jgi:hypothetical protein
MFALLLDINIYIYIYAGRLRFWWRQITDSVNLAGMADWLLEREG